VALGPRRLPGRLNGADSHPKSLPSVSTTRSPYPDTSSTVRTRVQGGPNVKWAEKAPPAGEDGHMPAFVPALELNRAFYQQSVAPLVQHWPHAAARIGFGSEVLGFDDERSTDHGWGPQLQVFVAPCDVEPARKAVDEGLPETFCDWPVRYGWDDVPVSHHVVVDSLGHWLQGHLGVDATGELSVIDWLLMPQQLLLEVVGGAVYHDDSAQLGRLRQTLAW
jgi:hypothetical protein